MALKFLNKKGWHTGSLRNIENVWKAEQKHDAEQKKLEELRKQIHEERERSEFRQLQEAAGLVPRQERLDFLYESGLAVGKGSSDGFKALHVQPSGGASTTAPTTAAESSSSKAAVPGALFEDKPQSANDAWRKLHSDPLLLIRQREQEALARIKNNPIRMAMIRKSIESGNKQQEVKKERKKKRNKHKHDQSKPKDKNLSKSQSDSEYGSEYEDHRRREWQQHSNAEDKEDRRNEEEGGKRKKNHSTEQRENINENVEKHSSILRSHSKSDRHKHSEHDNQSQKQKQKSGYNNRRGVPKMTEEEREERLREMQMDAELHEDQRWKRLKKAAEDDALEAKQATYSRGKSFLDATQKSVYGMGEGGSATIEESVRRRTYYSQGHSAHDTNAFRR
ncbi:hypothetical protein M5K25_011538 [Dendrobium thyrsiflorum]|uniref:CBF1-interacting co-repressor CIR N-terminal domain-containing protein n=1 Tax=Dendrobium thyrsiflorum TaxID=117978 RepID=A0ABD0V2I8_DENTH